MRKWKLLILLLTACAVPLLSDPIDILILHSYNIGFPWVEEFQAGLIDAQTDNQQIQYYSEFMDVTRIRGAFSRDQWREYLRAKYGKIGIDVIIAESGAAADFLYANPEMFGRVPQVLYSPVPYATESYQLSLNPNIENVITDTVNLALLQNPKSNKAIIVNGGNPATASTLSHLKSTLEKLSISITEISDFSYGELRQKLETCDKNSIVFYTLVFTDKNGKQFIPGNVLKQLSIVSAAPIYTFWGTLARNGSTGGVMIDARVTAYEVVKASLDYLNTGHFGTDYGTTRTYIDWRELKRHGISTRNIPSDAVILNKPDPFLVRYYRESVSLFSLIILGAFIFVVILYRKNIRINKKLLLKSSELEQALNEKTIMYNEMNNRIKNNLSILSSMISLQINEIRNAEFRKELENVVGRIQTLALVHEELSSHTNIKKTNMRDYLRALILMVFNAISTDPAEERLHMDIDEIMLENKDAVACGLIVHELLTNALKYAFPDNINGMIIIKFKKVSPGDVELSVFDSGVSFPASFSFLGNARLGLKIVQSLVQQMDGSIHIKNNGEKGFIISFLV